jgi:hypothetical protein
MYPKSAEEAAVSLLREIGVSPMAASVSTFSRGSTKILRVFLPPHLRHLRSKLPRFWRGWIIECEIADIPKTQRRA